jgi:hypothetical protein
LIELFLKHIEADIFHPGYPRMLDPLKDLNQTDAQEKNPSPAQVPGRG